MSEVPSHTNLVLKNSVEGHENVNDFIISYSKEMDYYGKSKLLHSFTMIFISKYGQNMISANGYMEILCEVPNLCEKFLTGALISNNTEIELDYISSILIKNLENASLCFEIIQKTLETITVVPLISPISKIAATILLLGYNHCQDSETIYGDFLEKFADQLGIFFKKIENLQVIMLKKINELCSIKGIEDHSSINSLVCEFGNLCEVVSNLDPSSAFELWTTYIKFMTYHQYLLISLDLNPVITCLLSKNIETLELINYNLEKKIDEDEEIFTSFSFYLNILSSILSLLKDGSQEALKKNVLQLKIFLLKLLGCLTLCFLPCKSCNLKNYKDCLIKITHTVLSNILKVKELLELIITNEPMQKLDELETKQSKTALLLLNLCSLQYIKNASKQQRKQMFCSIMSILSSNKTKNEINLLYTRFPWCAVAETDSLEVIDLYQFAYEELTKFLKSFPDSLIQELNENVLNESVTLSDIDYLLISDIWSYRLRCSNISFLKDQCCSMLQNYHSENTQEGTKLESFLKRIMKFLPLTERNSLSQEFKQLSFLQDIVQIPHRYGTPDLFSTDHNFPNVSDEKIQEMMLELNAFDTGDVLQLIRKSCLIMDMCTLFVNVSGSSQILQFVELAEKLFKSEIYEVQVAVLTFIKAFSRKHLPENSNEFELVVLIMAKLFSSAINCKNYFICCEALSTFSFFAKCTPHVKIVQETVRKNPSLKPLIKSYISAVPETGFLTEEEKNSYINQCNKLKRNRSELVISENSRKLLLDIFPEQ